MECVRITLFGGVDHDDHRAYGRRSIVFSAEL